MTTTNHGNTRLPPCTCQRQLNQEHRRSRTRKAPQEPHVLGGWGPQEGVVQLSCVWVSVTQLLELFHSCKRASAELQSLLPLFIVIGHKWNESGMQSKYDFWKSNSLEMIKRKKSPSACAMVWIVASDKSTQSRASSHKPMRCAKSSLYAASTHSYTTCNPQDVAIFKYQEKDTVRRFHVSARLACLDLQGQAHVNNDDGHRTSASATEDVRDAGQRIFLAHTLLLDLPNPKAARHAVALHNSQRPQRSFPGAPSGRPPSSSFSSPGGELLSTQQPTKWRRVDVVEPTVQLPDAGNYQELR